MAVKNIEYRRPTPEDCAYLDLHLRQADRDEMAAAGVSNTLESIIRSVENSDDPMAVFGDGKLALMFGVVEGETEHVCWCLGTDMVDQNKRQFMRESFRVLSSLQWRYPLMTNFVDVRNTKALKWLKHVGFEMDGPWPVDSGHNFMQIFLRGNNHV